MFSQIIKKRSFQVTGKDIIDYDLAKYSWLKKCLKHNAFHGGQIIGGKINFVGSSARQRTHFA